jgi:adenine deaminase
MKPAGLIGSWLGLVAAAFGSGTAGLADAANGAAADLVLQNGFVYTVDDRNSVQQAIAIHGGRIVYVGNDQGARAYKASRQR